MPKTHTHTTYSYEELSQEAKTKAVEVIRDMLSETWGDMSDKEEIEQEILFTLAEKLDVPGWNDHGPGDFPGIPGLTITGWDLSDHTLTLDGSLTPETAPGLPWPADCNLWRIGKTNSDWNCNYADLWLTDVYPEWMASQNRADVAAFHEDFRNATTAALEAGRRAYEYRTGEEYARERCEDDGWEFNEDGTLHR